MTSHADGSMRIETPHLSNLRYPAPTAERIVPRRPRPTGASTVASATFREEYESLFATPWINSPTKDGGDVGYVSEVNASIFAAIPMLTAVWI